MVAPSSGGFATLSTRVKKLLNCKKFCSIGAFRAWFTWRCAVKHNFYFFCIRDLNFGSTTDRMEKRKKPRTQGFEPTTSLSWSVHSTAASLTTSLDDIVQVKKPGCINYFFLGFRDHVSVEFSAKLLSFLTTQVGTRWILVQAEKFLTSSIRISSDFNFLFMSLSLPKDFKVGSTLHL